MSQSPDLVNLRFALSFVRTWDWPKVLRELLRVVRPGGVIRLPDEEVIHQSNSPASMQFCQMLLIALFNSGHLFTRESTGLTAHLAPLLSQHGCQQVQTRAHALQYRAGTPLYTKKWAGSQWVCHKFLQMGCPGGKMDLS